MNIVADYISVGHSVIARFDPLSANLTKRSSTLEQFV